MSFQDVFDFLSTKKADVYFQPLMTGILATTRPASLRVRMGDLYPGCPDRDKPMTHMSATVLANLLTALAHAWDGSGNPRFQRAEGADMYQEPYYFGYHADDWVSILYAYFGYRSRRKNDRQKDQKPSVLEIRRVPVYEHVTDGALLRGDADQV